MTSKCPPTHIQIMILGIRCTKERDFCMVAAAMVLRRGGGAVEAQ